MSTTTTTTAIEADTRTPTKKDAKATAAQKRAANLTDTAQQDLGFFAPDLKKPVAEGGATIEDIPLELVDDDPEKVRKVKPEIVKERAESMKLVGQRDPIEVHPNGERYVINEGHHRAAAARLLKWPTIRAIVVKADTTQAAVTAAVTNMSREQHNMYEDGAALARLKAQRPGITNETLGKIVGGRSAAWVAERLRVHALGPEIGPVAHLIEERDFAEVEALASAHGIEDPKLAQQVRDITRSVVSKMKPTDDWWSYDRELDRRLQAAGWIKSFPYPLCYEEAAKKALAKAPAVRPLSERTGPVLYYFPKSEVAKLEAEIAAKKKETVAKAAKGSTSAKAELERAAARKKERREAEIHKRAEDRQLIALAKGGARASEDLEHELLIRALCNDAEYDSNEADRIAAATELPFSGVEKWGKKGMMPYGASRAGPRLEYIKGLKPDQRRRFVAAVAAVHVDTPDVLKLVARTTYKDIEASARKEVLQEEKAFEKGAKPKQWWQDERRAACPVCKAGVKQKCCSSPGGHTIAVYHAERTAAAAKVPIVEPKPKPKKNAKKAPAPKKAAPAKDLDDEDLDEWYNEHLLMLDDASFEFMARLPHERAGILFSREDGKLHYRAPYRGYQK